MFDRIIINDKDQSIMMLIPEGEFLMGSSDENIDSYTYEYGEKSEWFEDERPQHLVYLDPYYIDKYPVTNIQYEKFVRETGYRYPKHWGEAKFCHPNQPVIGVDWLDAIEYCKWSDKRLPTEAEWEKAARGVDCRVYPWGNLFSEGKCNSGSRYDGPSIVGSYPDGSSPYDVMDMAGNVWEWCLDWYDENYYYYSIYKNPIGPEKGISRCVRGGCWINHVVFLRCSERDFRRKPRYDLRYFGFRCVRPIKEDDLLAVAEAQESSSLNAGALLISKRIEDDSKVVLGDIAPPDISSLTLGDLKPEDVELDILYEDDDVIVINKKAGMMVHPTNDRKSGTLVNALLSHCKNLSTLAGFDRPGIVHRLDTNTTGVMVVAKTDIAYLSLTKQFAVHATRRRYWALLHGILPQNSGSIIAPVGKSREYFATMEIRHFFSKEAITHYTVLEKYFGKFCLVELELDTGRTHQIRLHMEHVGYPLVGERKYHTGSKYALSTVRSPEVRRVLGNFGRQALHAKMLGFVHPTRREMMEFFSPVPQDMQVILDVLKRESRSN